MLDGGLATQLEAQGHDIGTRLWSAALLREAPRAIVDAHRTFLDAGAECIISASYQASRQGFMAAGLSAREADELIAGSVRLAMAARDEFLQAHPGTTFAPLVAASVGPYGAALHDGSEYRGGYAANEATLLEFHSERLALLDGAGADVLACETIPDQREAQVLARLLQEVDTPAWVSFSCRDDSSISDGTPIADVVRLFDGHDKVPAVGINCTAPRYVTPLIRHVRGAAPRKSVVVYPNSGENYDVVSNSWSGTVEPGGLATMAGEWFAEGATLIGGCCRMTPEHIAALTKACRKLRA